MANVAQELIILRNEFYLQSYGQIKTIIVVLLLTCALLVGFSLRQEEVLRPLPQYFPTTPDGRLINNPPVSENHLLLSNQKVNAETGIIEGMPEPTILFSELEADGENALVLYWAYNAVSEMFDYDYIHYRSVIQEVSKYFTAIGHQRFITALIDSKNLETVKARSAVVIPEITGKVKLMGTGMVEGHYSWDLQVPVQLTYASAQDQQPIVQQLLAKLSVARVSTLLSPFYGLAIYRLNFEEVTKVQAG